MNLIKIKPIRSLKDTTKRIKRETTNWEKIFAKHLTDEGLVSKIHKEYWKFNNKKVNNPVKDGKDLNKHFTKEDTQMSNKHKKRYSTSLVIVKMQIKITMRCHYTSIRITKIKDWPLLVLVSMWRPLIYCWWECQVVQPPRKTFWKDTTTSSVENPKYHTVTGIDKKC